MLVLGESLGAQSGGGGIAKLERMNIYQEESATTAAPVATTVYLPPPEPTTVEPTAVMAPTTQTSVTQPESQIAPAVTYVPVAVEEPAPQVFAVPVQEPTTPTADEPETFSARCSAGFYWSGFERGCVPMSSQAEAALPSGEQTFVKEVETTVAAVAVPVAPAPRAAPPKRIDRNALPAAPSVPLPAVPEGYTLVSEEEPASWLDKKIFGEFKVKHALIGAAVSVAGIVTIRALR